MMQDSGLPATGTQREVRVTKVIEHLESGAWSNQILIAVPERLQE